MPRSEPTPLTLLRRAHEAQVLDLLRRLGALSRAELARRTGLSRTALSSITTSLITRALVVTVPAPAEGPRGRGRPVGLLRLDPATGRCAGVDLGRVRVRAVVANAAHETIATASRPCPPHASWQHRTELALELLDELLGGAAQGLEGIGVGVVGPVTGAAERDLGVARRFGEQYGVPVLVDNNTRLAALAETVHGAGAGSRHVVYVRLSHGVGGGVVVDGRLLRGAGGTAGEIGHITVEPTGPRCQCGGHGCLELYASLPAVAAAGGPENDAAVARAGRLTGRMLAGLCAAVNPELLIVGGELARCGARLLTPLRTELRARTLSAARAGVRVVGERLGDEAGALGGMVLVRQETPALYGAPTGDAVALSMADRNAASADGCCTGPVASGSC